MFVIFRKINLCLFTKEDRLADKPNVKITCGGWRGEKMGFIRHEHLASSHDA